MIIIITPQGQLANRILHAGHFIANAIEYKHFIYHLSFNEYFHFFEEQLNLPTTKKYIKFISIKNNFLMIFIKAFIFFARRMYIFNNGNFIFFHYIYLPSGTWEKQIVYDLSLPRFIHKTKKLTFVDGWEFRDEISFLKHRDSLVKVFKPNEKYCQDVDALVKGYKKKYNLLIGVHIRRGDYIKFMNGIYNFGDDFYRNKMKQIRLLEPFHGKKTLFVICSNEKIDSKSFSDFNIDYAPRHFIIDLLLLSSCDFIIGPPSTFTMWASYFGSTPMCYLTHETQVVTLDSFNIYGAMQHI